MVIDFSKVDAKEMPVLILRNLDGTAIQTLGCAYHLQAELCYNEVSTITFDLPKYVDGIQTPNYDAVIGTRIVDMNGWGQFLLVDPETSNDGVKEIKACKAYSLEYEFTKKKMSLEESTYNFWNPTAPDETVLGIILSYMPSWSVGTVDSALIGKYRTFSVNYENLYDFMKSTLQKTYSCIFEFDTYKRKVNVKHTDSGADTTPVYLSLDNLAKLIKIQEDTENIFTVLDVNGAEGVDIRNVNPLGTNKIYNLDYFMNTSHFDQSMIDKWNSWKQTCLQYELTYYNTSIERMLLTSKILTTQNKYNELRDVELATLRNSQSTKTELLAALSAGKVYLGLSSTPPTDQYGVHEPAVGGYSRVELLYVEGGTVSGTVQNCTLISFPTSQGDWFDGHGDEFARYWVLFDSESGGNALTYGEIDREDSALIIQTGDTFRLQPGDVVVTLTNIAVANCSSYLQTIAQLKTIKAQIDAIEANMESCDDDIRQLQQEKDVLTQDLIAINRACTLSSFFTESELLILDRYFIEDSIAESSFVVSSVKDYTDAGYSIDVIGATLDYVGGNITEVTVSGTGRHVYSDNGGTLTLTDHEINANIVKSVIEIDNNGSFIMTAYLGSGSIGDSHFQSGCISMTGTHGQWQDAMQLDPEIGGSGNYQTGPALQMDITSAQLYFTQNTTEYEQYAVEWDLLEYGRDCLQKLAYPSYTFSVDSANFFALDEFRRFVDAIALGKRIYLNMGDEKVLTPILVKVSLEFDDPTELTLEFGSTYNALNNAFQLVDLLEQSVSMGKTVDTNRFNYNSFIDSGASTAVKDFMDSALDVSKNAVLSGSNMAISWDSSGIHCRKDNGSGGFEPEEIAILNNNIVFTDDNWRTAKMAIGHFVDANTGDAWGIVAPHIVGTLLAGQNLVIESNKKDGGVAVFRVDGDGAVLHNARFDIEDANRHILLDPKLGIAIGAYPVIKNVDGTDTVDIGTAANPGKAKFWVDTNGNVFIRGTLEGCDGTFNGELYGGSISIGNGTFTVDTNGNLTANSGTFKGTLYGATYKDGNGSNMMNGDGQFTSGYLDLHGLIIRDNNNQITFKIDSNGNVTLGGNSVISYDSIANTPTIPDVPAYITSTGISSTSIWSPNIYGGSLTIDPRTDENTGSPVHPGTITVKNTSGITTFSVDSNGNVTADSITIGGQTSIDWTNIQETGQSAGAIAAQNALNKSRAIFGTCSATAAETVKSVTCNNFELYTGATVTVAFTYGNTAANAQMSVNGTGAKPIYAGGAPISGVYNWGANSSVTFTYDGSYWVMTNTSALHMIGDWCYNNDVTYIDGGHIYTGTIACNKLAAGQIDSNSITLGSTYGGFCTAQGNDGTQITYGAKMFGSNGSTGDYYFFVTNAGTMMHAPSNNNPAHGTRLWVGADYIYASEAISGPSDRNLKRDINYDLSKYKVIYRGLKPAAFFYKAQVDHAEHFGLIAQDAESTLQEYGMTIDDVAFLTKHPVEEDGATVERYSIAYSELIALNMSMIQDLIQEVDRLKEKISALEKE